MVKPVIWPLKAQLQLERIIKYITTKSYQNAEKVKIEILASTRKIEGNPEMYPLDKYKKNNDGSFRAYELHRYRIAYRVTKDEIIITRIWHTSMVPKLY
jgi:plasmid stabilization system protein ParE